MRVLVVEDFEPMARAIVTGLRREGMAVDVAYDGDEALDHLALARYDVVVLDRDLPGVHGDEICRRLAAGRSPSRILMLTAAGGLTDRVDGLNLGAADYLAKPFDFPELEYLLGCAGRVVSAEELLERVWDEAADPFTTAVKQTMRRLRAKLGDPPVIATVREGGYQIGEPDA